MEKICKERGGSSNTVDMVSRMLQGHLKPYLIALFQDLSALKDERVNNVLREYFGGEFSK